MTANRQRKLAARAVSASTGRSYTASLRLAAPAGAGGPLPAVVGPPRPPGWDWRRPESGTEDRFEHWVDWLRRKEVDKALRVDAGSRALHLSERWTVRLPTRHNLHRLLAVLYAVVLSEQPGLAPDAEQTAWLAEQAEDLRVLGAIDAACYDVDRAVRQLAGNHFGDSRHTPGTDERIRAWAEQPAPGGNVRDLRFMWHRLHEPIDGPGGYPYVHLPWNNARATLDQVLIRSTGGILPGTAVDVVNRHGEPYARGQVLTAWWDWNQDGPPSAYLLTGPMSATEPVPADRLRPNPEGAAR